MKLLIETENSAHARTTWNTTNLMYLPPRDGLRKTTVLSQRLRTRSGSLSDVMGCPASE